MALEGPKIEKNEALIEKIENKENEAIPTLEALENLEQTEISDLPSFKTPENFIAFINDTPEALIPIITDQTKEKLANESPKNTNETK